MIRKTPLYRVLRGLLNYRHAISCVQIGSNDGAINDPIFDFLIRHRHRTEVLLIEPQLDLVPILERNYRKHPRARVLAKAIAPTSGNLTLYRIRPRYHSLVDASYLGDVPLWRVPTGITSVDHEHVESFWVRYGKPDLVPVAEAIEPVQVPTVTLSEAVRETEFPQSFDVLVVDVEGLDYELVQSALVQGFRPRVIQYEEQHQTSQEKQVAARTLSEFGYESLHHDRYDHIWVRKGD